MLAVKLHQFHVGKVQAHNRVGRGYQNIGVRLIAVSNPSRIRMEPSLPYQPQMNYLHASEVPLGIRYLRAEYNAYSTTCSRSAADHSVEREWFSHMQGSWNWSRRFSSPKKILHRTLEEYSTLPPAFSMH